MNTLGVMGISLEIRMSLTQPGASRDTAELAPPGRWYRPRRGGGRLHEVSQPGGELEIPIHCIVDDRQRLAQRALEGHAPALPAAARRGGELDIEQAVEAARPRQPLGPPEVVGLGHD